MGETSEAAKLVDAKMDVVLEMLPRGQTLTHMEIAKLTGLSRSAAHKIEHRALRKALELIKKQGITFDDIEV